MKKTGKRSIWISIVVAAMLLTGCGNQTGSADRATGSDAVESVPSTTEVVEITTEETTTEAALEVVSNEGNKPEAVPATTEIGGGKKKAEETTEEQKPNANHSSNSGNASNGQSTAPKPSNSGNSDNSGNSGSNNSGNSNPTPSQKPSTPATTEAPTSQHQHNYNVWVKTKDAWDETVIDQAAYDETIAHPAEYKTVPAVECHGCGGVFTSADAYLSHPCGDDYGTTTTTAKQMTKDAWTETKHHDEKSHVVHHDEEGYWKCECGARK